jgi:hypothetical protein
LGFKAQSIESLNNTISQLAALGIGKGGKKKTLRTAAMVRRKDEWFFARLYKGRGQSRNEWLSG